MKRVYIFLFFLFLVSCSDDDPITEEETIPSFVLAGGATTIFDVTSNAYATPAPNLSPSNFEKHLAGDLAFEQTFVTEPAVVNPGLGPLFNNNSCVSCHVRNGRSLPSLTGDEISGFLLRVSIPGENLLGGPKPVPNFGTQIQTRSIFESQREASFSTEEITKLVEFIDGHTVSLSKQRYIVESTYLPLPDDLLVSPRVAPSVFGLGLLEAISEEDILAIAADQVQNFEGISGKINQVWNAQLNLYQRGIFGWKAEMPTALVQAADAYHQDMGITSSIFPVESCEGQTNCNSDEIMDIDDKALEETTFYFQSLAVPAVRNYRTEEFLRGQDLFESVQCNSCHTPKHITSKGVIEELSNQEIYPYTDLLLHDMGEGLSDGRPSFEAEGIEWRTPPLWGIGLLPVVNGHTRLLHDGRAKNIEEAILWHGGEASTSREKFMSLTKEDRADLIFFVESI